MAITFFGSYDSDRHPRIRVLLEGLEDLGLEVEECNVPMKSSTDARVAALSNGIAAFRFVAGLLRSWLRLWLLAGKTRKPEVVVVGYLGHFDVRLARRRWPSAYIILDHLISAFETAVDRGVSSRPVLGVLRRIDRKATGAADLVVVDTLENVDSSGKSECLVVAVGADRRWYREPSARPLSPLRVVFFATFSPLQGAVFVGEAIGLLADTDIEFTMIGTGQDRAEAEELAAGNSLVTWIDWVDPPDLPDVVSSHDVCLGIFGTTDKAVRVVPNKVFQGAAAGCCIVTSDTLPQRRALGDAASFVPRGDARALSAELRRLRHFPSAVASMRVAAFERAAAEFTGAHVAADLSHKIETILVGPPRAS